MKDPRTVAAIALTAVICCLMFAIPGLHQTYRELIKEPDRTLAPAVFARETTNWGTVNAPSLKADWILVVSTIAPSSKSGESNQRKIFVSAKLTNQKQVSIDLSHLTFKLSLGDVELFEHTVFTRSTLTLPPNEAKTLQFSAFLDKELLVGLADQKIAISGAASFSDSRR